jgi:hypothetical protein
MIIWHTVALYGYMLSKLLQVPSIHCISGNILGNLTCWASGKQQCIEDYNLLNEDFKSKFEVLLFFSFSLFEINHSFTLQLDLEKIISLENLTELELSLYFTSPVLHPVYNKEGHAINNLVYVGSQISERYFNLNVIKYLKLSS